jgi:hypothetical protein
VAHAIAIRFRKTLILLILGSALRSANAEVAASLPRHGGVKPPLRHAGLKVSVTTAGGNCPGSAGSPEKPFTQEQVSNMVRAGVADEPGAKLIEQRGIDFAPAEEFLQTLKAAGAAGEKRQRNQNPS